jgi:hypothetical protein
MVYNITKRTWELPYKQKGMKKVINVEWTMDKA